MTTLHRVTVQWGGPMVVGAAVNVLHYSASDNQAPPVAAIKTAYQGISGTLPSGCVITIPSSGDTIDDTTGELVGVWTASGGGAVTGNGGSNIAAGVGACLGWATGGIVNGRKLRGRTFIVPLANVAYDSDGTLASGHLAVLQTLAANLMAAGPLAVWHRPTTAGGSDGNSYGVIAYKVRDKVAFLSSRRD